MTILLRWLVSAVALLAVAYIVPDISVASFYSALIVIVVLGLVNAVIRPLILLLTLPLNILTLGLFTFVINAGTFWFVSSVVKGFDVAGFGAAFIGALVLTFVSWIMKDSRK